MYLIVGLGNIGDEYKNTRHNVGFMYLDYLKDSLEINESFKEHTKLNCEIVKTKKFILVKPTTFMNDSGIAVQKVKNYFTVPLEKIYVVHDDIDQRLGRFKLIPNGGSGGHRGIDSIKKQLNTENFARLKIGIAPEIYNPSIHKAEDFVLKSFNKEEQETIPSIFSEITRKFVEQLS